MGFETFLIQLVLLSCVFFLLRATVVPRGWVALAVIILVISGATFFLAPAYMVWVSGGLWLVFFLIPLLALGWVNRLVAQERYRLASKIIRYIRWLHPLDGLMEYPELLHGLDLGQQGKIDAALRIFRKYQTATTANGRMATAILYRTGALWEEALQWVRQNIPARIRLSDGAIGIIYLRSLGETGDLNTLLHELERFEQELEKMGDSFTLSLCRMFALAFCGQVDQVQAAFNGPLAVYPERMQQFWLATAELVNGHPQSARQKLLTLRHDADVAEQHAIDWRLAQAPIKLNEVLTDSSRRILLRLRIDISQEAHYNLRQVLKGQNTYATYSLIAANLGMFALQVALGGTDNFAILYRLGALIPKLALAGEWWRTLTANFLHLNILHLLTNMIGLYLFGRFVEAILGTGRFLVAYFVSGMGAMLIVAMQAALLGNPDIYCVGASGAVMGLLGVMGSIFLRGWRENIRFAGRQFRWILILMALQVGSDLFNPEVSLVGHLSGLILGFVLGYALSSLRSPLKPYLER